MRKLLRAALAAFFIASASAPSLADNRETNYFSEMPSSSQANQEARYLRLDAGTFRAALIGTNGAYYNLSVTPTTGLYVQVGPSVANTQGVVYQYLPDDANPWGGGPVSSSGQLPADPTLTMIGGTTTANLPPIGPLAVPGSNSQISLIECQVQTYDGVSTSTPFIDLTGHKATYTVPQARLDGLTCQAKAGTPAASPAVPSTDTGWIAVGYVTVPAGTTTITDGPGGMITAEPTLLGGGLVTKDTNGNVLLTGSLTINQENALTFQNVASANGTTTLSADGTQTVSNVANTAFGLNVATIGSPLAIDSALNVGFGANVRAEHGALFVGPSGGYSPGGDDLVLSRSASCGNIVWAQGNATLDYGCTSSGFFTMNHGLNASGPITGTGYSGGPISGTTGAFSGSITSSAAAPLIYGNTAGSSSSTYLRGDGGCTVRGITGTVFSIQSVPLGGCGFTLDVNDNVGYAGAIYSGSVSASGTSLFGPSLKLTLDDDGTNAYVKSPAGLFLYSNTAATAKVAQLDPSGNFLYPGYTAASTAAPTCGSTVPCTVAFSCTLSATSQCTASATIPSGAHCSVYWAGSSTIGSYSFAIDTVSASGTALSALVAELNSATNPVSGTASLRANCV